MSVGTVRVRCPECGKLVLVELVGTAEFSESGLSLSVTPEFEHQCRELVRPRSGWRVVKALSR